jgi:hypothetical protein
MNEICHEKCIDHSGIVAEIQALKDGLKENGSDMKTVKSRINIILGGVVVSCIMIIIDIIVRKL